MSRRKRKKTEPGSRQETSTRAPWWRGAFALRRDEASEPVLAPLYRDDPEPSAFFQSSWKSLAVALGCALVYRVIYFVFALATDPAFGQTLSGLDTSTYHEWAKKILDGDLTSSHTKVFYYGPVYPYVLAGVYAVFGVRPFVGIVFNMVLGLGVVGLVWGAMQPWFSRRVAFAAALGVGLCPGVVFYEAALLPAVVAFAGLSAFLLFLGMAQNRSPAAGDGEGAAGGAAWWLWVLAGLCLGVASVQRANSLLCVGGVAVWIGVYFHGRVGWARRAAWFALFLCGVLLPLIPTTAHNRIYGGQWVLVTSNGPTLLYIGNVHDGAGTFAYSDSYVGMLERKEAGEQIDWTGELVRDIARHPLGWLWVVARKAYMFWGAFDVPDNFSYDLARKMNPALRFGPIGFTLLAPLGLVGMVLAARRWRRLLALYLFVLTFWASLVAVFIVGRYRIPVLVGVSGFSGLTFWQGWNWFRNRRFGRGAALALAVVALCGGLMAYRQIPFGGIRTSDFKNAAAYCIQAEDFDRAADIMRDGEEHFEGLEPRTESGRELHDAVLRDMRFMRAGVLMRLERWADAETVLREMARKRQTGYREVEMLFETLTWQDRLEEAQALMRQLCEQDPANEEYRRQLEALDDFLERQGK